MWESFIKEIDREIIRDLERRAREIEQEEVRTKAYYLWEELGRPEGQADQIWLQAEQYYKDTKPREVHRFIGSGERVEI